MLSVRALLHRHFSVDTKILSRTECAAGHTHTQYCAMYAVCVHW